MNRVAHLSCFVSILTYCVLSLLLWVRYGEIARFQVKWWVGRSSGGGILPEATPPSELVRQQGAVPLALVLCNPRGVGPNARGMASWTMKYVRQVQALIKSLLINEYEYRVREGLNGSSVPSLELLVFTDNAAIFAHIDYFLHRSGHVHNAYAEAIALKFVAAAYPDWFEHLKYLLYPCATFRLLLGLLLPSTYDSILYVDTDVIFMKNVRAVYDEVHNFDARQWLALGPDAYQARAPQLQIPHYGTHGLNSGVGVYNLTRMRHPSRQFLVEVLRIFEEYGSRVGSAGDQDVINIYLHIRPEEVRLLACEQNYITYFCGWPPPGCLGGEVGIAVIHGASDAFGVGANTNSQFAVIFEEYEQLELREVVHDFWPFRVGLRRRLEANYAMEEASGASDGMSNQPEEWRSWFESACARNSNFINKLLP